MAYEWFLRTHVSQTPVEIVRFCDRSARPSRLPVIVGLIALNAAVVGLAVLLLLTGVVAVGVSAIGTRLAPARVRSRGCCPALVLRCLCGRRSRAAVAVAARDRLFAAGGGVADAPLSRVDRHGSQAMQLLLSFLAVALPSIVLYPSLVDASERARRQLIETRYAPEVMNQRQDLRIEAAEGARRDRSHRGARRSGARQRSAASPARRRPMPRSWCGRRRAWRPSA